jgi:hypothetical protein
MTDDTQSGTDAPAADSADADRSPGTTTPLDRPQTTADPGVFHDRPGDVETSVPDGAPVYRCSHCGRPFATESFLALHRGLAHGTALTADERDAYESALAAETADIRRFRIIALGGLVALYFGLLFAYAVFA